MILVVLIIFMECQDYFLHFYLSFIVQSQVKIHTATRKWLLGLMIIRVVEFFYGGIQSWKVFLTKDRHIQGNFWILRIGVMGRYQKVPSFDFQSQFPESKIIGIFLNFFSIFFYKIRNVFGQKSISSNKVILDS